jgi:V8-like Glu-specific endopeptidase
MRAWTNAEEVEFRSHLDRLFDEDTLKRLLSDRLGRKLSAATSARLPLPQQLFELMGAARMEGFAYDMLFAAVAERPRDEKLEEFAQRMQMVAPLARGLQKMVTAAGIVNPVAFRHRLAEWERWVCRVELPRQRTAGTGFLVGPDLVLTNYHVVASAIDSSSGGNVICRFDFKMDENNREIAPGKTYGLSAQTPFLAFSPSDPKDENQGVPLSESWGTDRLDFALLRLESPAGNERFGPAENADSTGASPTRKWAALSTKEYAFTQDESLTVVQHPQREPVGVAFEPRSVIGLNANRTRVRHRTNTKDGSSGSPCLNEHWECVALHHAGDPADNAVYNQAIPISVILAYLRQKGQDGLVAAA